MIVNRNIVDVYISQNKNESTPTNAKKQQLTENKKNTKYQNVS